MLSALPPFDAPIRNHYLIELLHQSIKELCVESWKSTRKIGPIQSSSKLTVSFFFFASAEIILKITLMFFLIPYSDSGLKRSATCCRFSAEKYCLATFAVSRVCSSVMSTKITGALTLHVWSENSFRRQMSAPGPTRS